MRLNSPGFPVKACNPPVAKMSNQNLLSVLENQQYNIEEFYYKLSSLFFETFAFVGEAAISIDSCVPR